MKFTEKQRVVLIEERGQPTLSIEFDVWDEDKVSMWTHFNHSDDFQIVKKKLMAIKNHLDEFLKDEAMCPFHKNKKEESVLNIPEKIRDAIKKGKALQEMAPSYPIRFNGKVPLKVLMLQTVKGLPFLMPNTVAHKRQQYYVSVNSYGAVSVILIDGSELGVKPDEFEVVEFH